MRVLRLIGLLFAFAAPGVLAQSAGDRAEWPNADFSRRTIDLREIQSGGPRKDGIPAIDRPRFDSVGAAQSWLGPREPVIAVRLGNDARAYRFGALEPVINDE